MPKLGQTPDVHERLLAACPIAVVAAEVDRLVYANPAALRLLAIDDPARVPALPLVDLFHPDDRASVAAWLASAEDVPPALQTRIARPDGSLRYIEATRATVPVTTGQAVLVTMQDVTERRRASERARSRELTQQQQQRLADIATVTTKVVHDVANPVAGLIMGTQRVLQLVDRLSPEVGTPLRPSIARVLDTSRKLAALLQEFRDFVGPQRLDLQTVGVARFLENTVADWNPEAKARGITVSVECPNELEVRADTLQLRRALDNLMRNALDAIDRGPGDVHLGASATADGKVRIVVRDTGPGITAGMDPFALFATTKSDGTGLGLPSVRQIVDAQGGTVRLVRDGPSGGACFAIELPAPRR